MRDIRKLRQALKFIRKYPENHNQRNWASCNTYWNPIDVRNSNGDHPPCGTTLCMAGWLAFLNAPKGAKIKDDFVVIGKTETYMPEYAIGVAKLTEEQAGALFYSAGTADHLERMIEHLAKHPDASRSDLLDAAGIEVTA